MKNFKIDERDYSVITTWEELTLQQYLDIANIEEDKGKFFVQEQYMMRVLEVLCGVDEGELDDIELTLLGEVMTYVDMLRVKPVWSNATHFYLDDVLYVLKKDMNKLTAGEFVSIKTLEDKYKGNKNALIVNLLSVFVRPGKLIVDPETGKDTYEIEKFDSKNLEYRKNLLLTKGKAVDLVGIIDFFLTGRE